MQGARSWCVTLIAKPLGAASLRDKLTAFAEAEGLPI